MYFEKYHGTGNDFILLKEIPSNPSKLAQKLCDRHFGVGADGILFPAGSNVADIKMHYYNADGSLARMCGNGIRCFAKFVRKHDFVSKDHFTVETLAGIKVVSIEDDIIKVNIGPAETHVGLTDLTKEVFSHEPISFHGIDGFVMNLGTLHTIIYVDQMPHESLEALAKTIQADQLFKDQTNVNFVHIIDDETMFVKTYERGVGWTLSCGTGASAAAFHAHFMDKIQQRLVHVFVPGGQLKVAIDKDAIYLIGPATFIFQGAI